MTDFSHLNYINAGPHGTFRPSGDLNTSPQDIDAIFDHLTQTGADRLVVHFHGGLVSEAKGLRIAKMMAPVYSCAGAHPVSFIWETGLIETISRNLTDIYQTKLFQKLIRFAIRELSKRLGPGLTGRGPGQPMDDMDIEAELAKLEKFEDLDARARGGAAQIDEAELDAIGREMELELQFDMDQDAEFLALLDEGGNRNAFLTQSKEADLDTSRGRGPTLFKIAKFLASVIVRVLRRFIRKRDHGLYPTLMEELVREFYLDDFGGWVWGKMKDAGRQMFLPNTGPLTADSHPGSYFLEKLAAHQAAHPAFAVDLVGHSAGSIAICEMFAAIDKAGHKIAIRNLMLLAPAATSQLFHDEIATHPERFTSFRVYTMADEVECADHLVPGIYTRSLLYLISGVLEAEADTPIIGMARYWQAEPPYDTPMLAANAAFLAAPDRAVLSITPDGAPAGFGSTAAKHGDFDNDPITQASLAHVISQPLSSG